MADSQDLARVRPVKREFGLEHLGARVRLDTLANGGGRVVHPCLTTHSEVGCRTQRVHDGGVPAINTRNGERVVCASNVVQALLPVGGQVVIGQVVDGPDSGTPRRRCGRTPSGGDVGVCSCESRWAPGPSPR